MKEREDLEPHNIPLPILPAQQVKGFPLKLSRLGREPERPLRLELTPRSKAIPPSIRPIQRLATLRDRRRVPAPRRDPLRVGQPRFRLGPRLLTHVQHTLGSGHLAPALTRRKPVVSPPPSLGPAPPAPPPRLGARRPRPRLSVSVGGGGRCGAVSELRRGDLVGARCCGNRPGAKTPAPRLINRL